MLELGLICFPDETFTSLCLININLTDQQIFISTE